LLLKVTNVVSIPNIPYAIIMSTMLSTHVKIQLVYFERGELRISDPLMFVLTQ